MTAPVIDEALVRRLLRAQFPQWAHLPVRAVERAGWDNRSFRVGDDKVARLPGAAAYAPQVEKEERWLAHLARFLPVAIPRPLALGEPADGYPWKWSIRGWIEGEPATAGVASDAAFAREVASFLAALQAIDATGGPAPGAHNFHRGDAPAVYEGDVTRALEVLGPNAPAGAAALWRRASETRWTGEPVWVHGDVSPGNLLVRDSHLAGVIDFGMLGVGDPACDLGIAWTFFRGAAREAFRAALPLDEATWLRARAWVLWKALILAAGLARTNAVEWAHPRAVAEDVLG